MFDNLTNRNSLGVMNPLQFPVNGDNIFSTVDYVNGTATGDNVHLISDRSRLGYFINTLNTVTGHADNIFGVFTEWFEAWKRTKNTGLGKFSNKLTYIAIGINIGTSAYNNFTNGSLTTQEKWTYTAIDAGYSIISTAMSAGVTALVALIPGAGIWLAPLAGVGAGLLIDWIWTEMKIDNQSIEQMVKKWFNSLFN